MNERKYCITGINQLTGEREIMSGYFTEERAKFILANFKAEYGCLRTVFHTHLKVELIKK